MKKTMMTLLCIASLSGASACELGDVEGTAAAPASDDLDEDAVASEEVAGGEAAMCRYLGSWTLTTSCTVFTSLVAEAQMRCKARGGALERHQLELPCGFGKYRRIWYSCCAS
ncbi:MAG TPA: hypothetical protein VK698_08470 [Kofleriaceae bacterium]|nr:hypothetical protein [Kofleriaceae bacterium]